MTTTVKVMYATKIGEPDYAEQLLTENEAFFPQAREWAQANGFDRFRIAEYDLDTPPDFAAAVNVR